MEFQKNGLSLVCKSFSQVSVVVINTTTKVHLGSASISAGQEPAAGPDTGHRGVLLHGLLDLLSCRPHAFPPRGVTTHSEPDDSISILSQ